MRNVNRMHGHCNFSHKVYEKITQKIGYPNSIIELGCGNGGNLGKFNLSDKRIGIDPEKENIKNAVFRGIDCQFIYGDHNVLKNFKVNDFDLALTVSVLDHIEDFKVALLDMILISKNVILFEPYIKNTHRQANKYETKWWEITWYHDYEKYLKDSDYTIEPYPLYNEGSGKLYHLIHIKSF